MTRMAVVQANHRLNFWSGLDAAGELGSGVLVPSESSSRCRSTFLVEGVDMSGERAVRARASIWAERRLPRISTVWQREAMSARSGP